MDFENNDSGSTQVACPKRMAYEDLFSYVLLAYLTLIHWLSMFYYILTFEMTSESLSNSCTESSRERCMKISYHFTIKPY